MCILGRRIVAMIAILAIAATEASSNLLRQATFRRGPGPLKIYNEKELPSSPQELVLRMEKSTRYNTPTFNPMQVLTNPAFPSGGTFQIEGKIFPLLPFDNSTIIIHGKVQTIQPFLTQNQGAIYTEYTILVTEVLKNLDAPVVLDSTITADQLGGALRLTSGKIVMYRVATDVLIDSPGEYVLFMTRGGHGPDLQLLRAIRLQDDRVFPLALDPAASELSKQGKTDFLESLRDSLKKIK
jgi:hypothetical protein